jgi:hypothetical protein
MGCAGRADQQQVDCRGRKGSCAESEEPTISGLQRVRPELCVRVVNHRRNSPRRWREANAGLPWWRSPDEPAERNRRWAVERRKLAAKRRRRPQPEQSSGRLTCRRRRARARRARGDDGSSPTHGVPAIRRVGSRAKDDAVIAQNHGPWFGEPEASHRGFPRPTARRQIGLPRPSITRTREPQAPALPEQVDHQQFVERVSGIGRRPPLRSALDSSTRRPS